MKKFIVIFLLLCFMCLGTLCFAGDMPHALLNELDAFVYFGEIKELSTEEVTIIQKQNVKGDFVEGREFTYKQFGYPCVVNVDGVVRLSKQEDILKLVEVGKTYLIGVLNEDAIIWEVSSFDTKTLEILNSGDQFAEEMQRLLNQGSFEEAEAGRQSIVYGHPAEGSGGVIFDDDGLTAIFVSSNFWWWIVPLAALVAIVVILLIRYKKKD